MARAFGVSVPLMLDTTHNTILIGILLLLINTYCCFIEIHLASQNIIMENTLENEVRSALENARQSWEQSLRAKQLALERLRLVKEEYQAALNTAKSDDQTLKEIQEKSGGEEAAKQLKELQSQVSRLTKEVRFQHAELVEKQTKSATELKAFEHFKAKHEGKLSELQAMSHQQRRLPVPRVSDSNQFLQNALGDTSSDAWPGIFRKTTNSLKEDIADETSAISSLERILLNYETHFPAQPAPATKE